MTFIGKVMNGWSATLWTTGDAGRCKDEKRLALSVKMLRTDQSLVTIQSNI